MRVRDELRLVRVEDIVSFVAEQKYTTMKHRAGEELIEESLKALEEEFASRFVRIHRNALVAISHVEGLERDAAGHHHVRLTDGAMLPVSRRLATDVARTLRQASAGSFLSPAPVAI